MSQLLKVKKNEKRLLHHFMNKKQKKGLNFEETAFVLNEVRALTAFKNT